MNNLVEKHMENPHINKEGMIVMNGLKYFNSYKLDFFRFHIGDVVVSKMDLTSGIRKGDVFRVRGVDTNGQIRISDGLGSFCEYFFELYGVNDD